MLWQDYKTGATRKGGESCTAFAFYNLFESTWSGFPAVTSLQTGIDPIIHRNLNFLNQGKHKSKYV